MNDNISKLEIGFVSFDYISFKDGKRKKGSQAPLSSEGKQTFSFICKKIRVLMFNIHDSNEHLLIMID